MNTSDDKSATSPSSISIAVTVLYAVTILLAMTGNVLLIFIVRKRPETRTLTSFLFVNMAAADLLVTFVVMPVSLATPYTGGKWLPGMFGHVTCKLVYYSFFVSLLASILSLAAMAVDRFLAVMFPFHRFEKFRQAKVLTSVIWLSSMVFMSPVAVLMSLERSVCSFKFSQFGDIWKSITGFYIYLFLLIYFVPLLVISVLYGLVCRKLWQRKTPGIPTSEAEQRNEATKLRVVRRLVVIVAVFALCWLPAQSYHMILAINFELHEALPTYVMTLCFWVGHANSAVNPWLYMTLNDKFRRALCVLLHIRHPGTRLQARGSTTRYTKVAENHSVKRLRHEHDTATCHSELHHETAM